MINAYDFDGTIYDGDSSIDFYFYCLKRKPSLIIFLPIQIYGVLLYLFKIKNKDYMKEKIFSFLKKIDNVDDYVEGFWNKNYIKIKPFYFKQKEKSDVIISASPEFLIKPLEKKLKIDRVIATKVNKNTGKFESKNCHDYEKITRYEEFYKKNSIKQFYSDSIKADKAMLEYAKEGYLVIKNNVSRWKNEGQSIHIKKNKKLLNINKYTENQIKTFLFASSCIFTLLITLLITYSFDFSKNFNLLFDSDSSRVIGDMTNIYYDHYRLNVHPLFVLFVQPIVFILKGIVQNDILSIVILSSLVSSISVVFIYNILNLFSNSRTINVLLSYCYLFSFSNIVFTSGIEIYNLATLFLIILWYYTLKRLKENNFNKYSYIVLIILGLLSLSFTITNFIVFLIIMFMLWISKKIKLKNIIIITLISISLLFILSTLQFLVWHNTPKLLGKSLKSEATYIEKTNIPQKIINVITGDYYDSILGTDMEVKVIRDVKYQDDNYKLIFTNINIFNILVLSIFYILCLILVFRNIKKNLFINIGLILAILFNSILHTIYGNMNTFLYSLHFLYLIFIIFGINLAQEENKKILNFSIIYLSILLVLELLINAFRFKELFNIIRATLNSTYYLNTFGLLKTLIIYLGVICVLFILITIIFKLIKKIKQEKELDRKIIIISSIIFAAILIECTFVALETTKVYNKLLWKNLSPKYNTIKIDNKTK